MSATTTIRSPEVTYSIDVSPARPAIASVNNLRFRFPPQQLEQEDRTKDELMYNDEDPKDFPDGGAEAYTVLLGCFIGLIADFGLANSLGAIQSYVSSHQFDHLSSSTVSWVFSSFLATMYFGCVFSGEVFDNYGARIPLIIGTILTTGGLMLTANSVEVYQFVLSFGIVTGFGTSLCMAPLIGVLSHWFLKRRATATSIGTIGGLVGSSVFAVMLQKLYDTVGFPWAIRILAFICFGCLGISVFMVKERTSRNGMLRPTTTASSNNETSTTTTTTNESTVGISITNELSVFEILEPNTKSEFNFKKFANLFVGALDFSILKDKRFGLLIISVFCSEIITLTTLTYLSSYALAYGIKESSAYLLITIVSVCGIPSRLISGLIADKYGRFNVMVCTSVFMTISIFGLWVPAKSNIKMLYAFSVIFGIASSAILSLVPACAGQISKVENFGKVYGTLYFFLAFLTLLGMFCSSSLIGKGSLQDFDNFVYFEGGMSVASIFCWVISRYTCVGWKFCKF